MKNFFNNTKNNSNNNNTKKKDNNKNNSSVETPAPESKDTTNKAKNVRSEKSKKILKSPRDVLDFFIANGITFTVTTLKQIAFELLHAVFYARKICGYWQHLDLETRNILFCVAEKGRVFEEDDIVVRITSTLTPIIIDFGTCQTTWTEEKWRISAEYAKLNPTCNRVTDITTIIKNLKELTQSISVLKNDKQAIDFISALECVLETHPEIDDGGNIEILRNVLFHSKSDLFLEFRTKK